MEDFIVIDDLIRTAEYRGFKLKMTDPYGFVQIAGVEGQFTSWSAAQKHIDAMEAAKMTKAQIISASIKAEEAKKSKAA